MDKLHYSVMLKETIDSLKIKPDGIYVDLTLGMGGHSAAILKKLTTGHLYCFDKDQFALTIAKERLSKISPNFSLIKSDFKYIKSKLNELNVNHVDGIIADLGFSSPQVDQAERGFSYNKDAILDMRMDQEQEFSALELINTYSQDSLCQIFRDYADVMLFNKVAKAIICNRPITTTLQLVEIIKDAYPAAILRQKNPAKQIFQALRIEVNNELSSLQIMLKDALDLLKEQGILAIITFHSIEDRIVKKFIKQITNSNIPYKMPVQEDKKYLTKQILPSKTELEENKRSKSAKLRVIKKLF